MIEQAEQLLHLARLRQGVAIEPHRLGIGTWSPKPSSRNALSGHCCAVPCWVVHEGQPVPNLIRDLVVGKIVKRAQEQCLEHQHCVYWLAPGAGLPVRIRLAPDPFESRTKRLQRYHGINLKQRVFLCVQAPITVRKIEKTHLRHHHIPLLVYVSIIPQSQGLGNF